MCTYSTTTVQIFKKFKKILFSDLLQQCIQREHIIVCLHMVIKYPKEPGRKLSGSIFKNFNFLQYFPMYSECFKTYFQQNSTSKSRTTLNFWLMVCLYMVIQYPKAQGCSVSGSIFKNFYFYNTSERTKNTLKQIFRKLHSEVCTTLIFYLRV